MPSVAPEATRALVGVKLGGRFRLLRHAGNGALGALFEATDDAGATFAVKVIRREIVSDDALSRFIRTSSAMGTAQSKRFVPVVDVGHDLERDLVFVVAPYLPSESLAAVLARTGPLPPQAALRLVLQAAEAVAEAHAIDIVHRNVKPSNLFADVLEEGSIFVRIADHAIGRSAIGEAARLETSLSYRYVSPEQLSASRSSDRRTDVHGLGITLYELLAGKTPWSDAKSSSELVSAISAGDPPAVQDRAPWVTAEIAAVVDRAIRRDTERRFPSVEALAKSLRAIIQGSERLTPEMLVPLDAETHAKVAARVLGSGGDAFAPTMATGEATDAVADDLVGHRLGGRYQILRLLGHGGMGAVYEVEDARGVHFAAKVILRDMADRQVAAVARFLREGRAVTRIQDTHVTRTLELGTDMKLGVPFMIMELLTGRDLGGVLRERGAVATLPVLRVFLQAARGLAAAHAEGVIHRDVKPANIFLHAPGGGLEDAEITVKICDFGLAKSMEQVFGEQSSHDLTRSGGMLGTPYYMSPEHATNAKSADGRADIWSLCASLFEALTGRKLWGEPASLGELLAAVCAKVPPSLGKVAPRLDPGIAAVVDKGLARDPNERWANVTAMIEALEPLVGGSERVTLGELAHVDPASLGVSEEVARAEWAPKTETPARPVRLPETMLTGAGESDGGTAREAAAERERTTGASKALEREKGAARGRGRRVATLGALALLIAGGGVLATRRARVVAPGVVAAGAAGSASGVAASVGPPDFGSTMSANEKATAAYRAAIQAWRDGAIQGAWAKLEEATQLDPGFAAAHLRSLMLASRPDPTVRAHAKSASQLRSGLSEHDRAFLEAFLPWTEVPQDAEGSEKKLAALVKAHPEDADYAYGLCRMRTFTGNFEGILEACDVALRNDPQLVDALRMKAFASQVRGDEASAIKSYEACFQATRMATACLNDLSALQLAAGKCEDAAATARKWAAIEPADSTPYYVLALALQGAGQSVDTAREVLTQSWDRMGPDSRAPAEAQGSAAFDVLSGNFARAESRIAEWEKAIAKSDDEWTHLLVTLWKVTLFVETGRNAEALRVTKEFFKHRTVWTPSPTATDFLIFLRATQFRLGDLDEASWVTKRDAWRASLSPELKDVGSRAAGWGYAYAPSVRNEKDAIDALSALDQFRPLPGGTMRVPDFDEGIARVYVLAGHPREALPFAERAAHTCVGIDYPIESTRAFLRVGSAYEALNDGARACAAYAVVLARWGSDRRSVSANEARKAQARLKCVSGG